MKLIEILDRPIAFHRSLVKIVGSVNGALLLSQAIYWQNRPTRESNDGWWYKTAEDFREETGMGRYELDNAKKACKGILLHKLKGVPARTWYKVDEDVLQSRLLETSLLETSKQGCSGPPPQIAGNQQTIWTETNTETKAETNVRTRKDRGDMVEVVDFCKEQDLPMEDGVWFFNKCEGNGWTNDGKPIKDWKATIRAWKAAGYMASQKQSARKHGEDTNKTAHSVYELTKIIEAKQKIADELKRKHSFESPFGTRWSNDAKMMEYREEMKEIKYLNSQLAAM